MGVIIKVTVMTEEKFVNPALKMGRDHLAILSMAEAETNRTTQGSLNGFEAELEIIGIAMCVFYQAATCFRKCSGGPHILEALIGRAYNLSCSAYILIVRGFYDEGLNLIRSLGEIANLLMLTSGQGPEAQEWLESDKKDRLKNFGPSAVRKRLKHSGKPLIATDSWYEEFCEQFTHVTPETRPNHHGKFESGVAGGVLQTDGLNKSLGEMATISGSLALLVSHAFDFKDLFDALTHLVDHVKGEQN